MRNLLAVSCCSLVACGSGTTQGPGTTQGRAEPIAKPVPPAVPWGVPAGFRSETIPFPLEFAPSLGHKGVEELRFAPGFFDPTAGGYFSYAFVWRTEDAATLDAAGVGREVTTYFRGLIDAVDAKHELANKDSIVATAQPSGARFTVTAHVIDAFKSKQPLDLTGWAERRACRTGAVWAFVLAPAPSTLRAQLDALAAEATCDQPLPPAPPPSR